MAHQSGKPALKREKLGNGLIHQPVKRRRVAG